MLLGFAAIGQVVFSLTRGLLVPFSSGPGIPVSGGIIVHYYGAATGVGWPWIWGVSRRVDWRFDIPGRWLNYPEPSAKQIGEYVAARSLLLNPTLPGDAAELLLLENAKDGFTLRWPEALFATLLWIAICGALAYALEYLRKKLRARHQPGNTCVRCGYDLRGSLAEGRCPECGRKIDYERYEPPVSA